MDDARPPKGDTALADAFLLRCAEAERMSQAGAWFELCGLPYRERRIWRRKDGTGTPMQFSGSLIRDAGGFNRLLELWEPEPSCG